MINNYRLSYAAGNIIPQRTLDTKMIVSGKRSKRKFHLTLTYFSLIDITGITM